MNFFKRPLGRRSFFYWGFGLMAVKYNLDRAMARFLFDRPWYFWNYIKPASYDSINVAFHQDWKFYSLLLVTSLPFLVFGIILTVRRLRSTGLPMGACLLFFVPVINLIFFVVLCLVRPKEVTPAIQPIAKSSLAWLPRSAAGSALSSMIIVGVCGAMIACFATEALANYGWGLFVGLPFAMGLVAVLIYTGGAEKRTVGSCISVAVMPILFCGICLFIGAAEGLICLVMAAPIAILLAVFGGLVGYVITANRHSPVSPLAMLLVLASVPFTMGMEKKAGEAPPMLSVTSSVVIDAPPGKVWPNVISFSPIPPERDWILRTGVAYPIKARIDSSGVGAIRHCIFTTGEFVEPIEIWDEPHRLRFSVADQPEPMEELSPYPHLDTPHLHGYLQSHEGELRLTALPGGKTLLEGTTWYTDRIWPSGYWQMWSDLLIHRIHLRVLNHIKNLSERGSSNEG